MNLTKINFYAEGYYSGKEYDDNVFIRTETFEKMRDEILGIILYVSELDGKHSEVRGSVFFEKYTEEEIAGLDVELSCDGDILEEALTDIFEDNGFDFKEEAKIVKNYLDSVDSCTTFTVIVKKSQLEEFVEFINNLDKEG
jgi:hypothetical protein